MKKLLAFVAVAVLAPQQAAAKQPYHETSSPTAHPPAWVIVIHGGGWRLVGSGMAGIEHPEVERLNRWGYGTLNVDYHAGARSLKDVLSFYDGLRREVGKSTPICLDGASSGGHLALMAAQRRPDAACVISRGAPTRLANLHGDLLRDAHRFFDPHGGLARWSPAFYRLDQPALIAHAKDDPYVPFAQAKAMVGNAPHGTLATLRRGDEPWVHTSVKRADLQRFLRAERRLLQHAA